MAKSVKEAPRITPRRITPVVGLRLVVDPCVFR